MTLPLITQLHLLQLEQYSLKYYLKWNYDHRFSSTIPPKTKIKFTKKANLLLLTSFLLFIFLGILIVPVSFLAYLLLLFCFLFFPQPFLILSALLFIPLNLLSQSITKYQISSELAKYPNLTTIAITGSFGKTTVKNFLFQILDAHQYTTKTPHSYNTLFGIAKVINQELNRHTHFFICEFAAYKLGEIAELTELLKPQFAILTAIGSQHLQRFGNLKNTTSAKFELIDKLAKSNCLVNLDNSYIYQKIKSQFYRGINTYSLNNQLATFYLKNYQFTPSGVSFTFCHQKQNYLFTSPVFGTSALQDLLAAISMAFLLKVPTSIIQSAVKSITPASHRLELYQLNRSTIIDNTYSSNESGFTQIISDLKSVKGSKVLITPGLVELGEDSNQIHLQIGKLAAAVFDQIILVGQNSRTSHLNQGINNSSKVSYLTHHSDYWPKVKELSKNFDWILLENDLPENY